MKGAPAVVVLIEVKLGDEAVRVAELDEKPVGVVQVPEAAVQYCSPIEPMLAVVAALTLKASVVVALGADDPSVTLAGASCAADIFWSGTRARRRATMPKRNRKSLSTNLIVTKLYHYFSSHLTISFIPSQVGNY